MILYFLAKSTPAKDVVKNTYAETVKLTLLHAFSINPIRINDMVQVIVIKDLCLCHFDRKATKWPEVE